MRKRIDTGFTLIELVVVIVVLAIISLYASSQYLGVSRFSAKAAQQQGISVIRQIQLGRMQSNVSSSDAQANRYQLLVTDNCLGSVEACTASAPNQDDEFSHKVVIEGQDLQFQPEMEVQFDLLGNPCVVSGSSCVALAPSAELKIEVDSSSDNAGVCITSQGYVYGC
ncbi:prepilin-type N-terminal cleavage/methylation domain-containing protein [Vibrio gallicus]|uniref:prepilin-type N-terminal cleavage/methylation domain-containing protein n=1 Tax=Vibrio gallicus TaxID=190897 RepID=UPI0021C3C5FA|nr:prepilin-type N-terminal cleavage/methylation domain-containing protein [Vibrio gallicus]